MTDSATGRRENIKGRPCPVKPGWLPWIGLLVLYSLFKLWLTAGVDLGKDEAAYWYWGQHLDASFGLLPFSVLRLAHFILPYREWFLRLSFVLCGALSTLLLYRLCRLHDLSPSLSRWAAAAFAASHWIWHTTSYLHPDGFLVLCWLLSLYYARLSIPQDRPAVYVKMGLAVGLAVLSKYSGAFLALALFAWLLFTRPHPVRWRRLLCALIPALLVASPLIHAQLSTRFYLPTTLSTLSRIASDQNVLLRLVFFLLNPLFFVSPLLLYLLYRSWVRAALDLRRRVAPQRLLTFLPALVPVLGFSFFALYRGQIKGNWILPAFLSLWPLAFSQRLLPGRARWFLILTVVTGLLQALSVSIALKHPSALDALGRVFASPALDATYVRLVSTPDRRREPSSSWTERLCEYRGWQDLAGRFEALLRERNVPSSLPVLSTQYSIPFSLTYYGLKERSCYTIDDPRFRDLTDFFRQAGPPFPPQVLFAVRCGSPLPASLENLYPRQQRLGEIPRVDEGCAPVFYHVFLFSR